jgi:predicted RNase H-like HicB family nuclease
MTKEFMAVIERDGKFWIAYAPEMPGAFGQGNTVEEAKSSLAAAITLLLDDRREDGLRAVPADALRDTVCVS